VANAFLPAQKGAVATPPCYLPGVTLALAVAVLTLLVWGATLRRSIKRLEAIVADQAADVAMVRALPIVVFAVKPEGTDFRLLRSLGGGIDRSRYPEQEMRGKLLSTFVPRESAVWTGWASARDGLPVYLIHEGTRDTHLYASTFVPLEDGACGGATVKLGASKNSAPYTLSRVAVNRVEPG